MDDTEFGEYLRASQGIATSPRGEGELSRSADVRRRDEILAAMRSSQMVAEAGGDVGGPAGGGGVAGGVCHGSGFGGRRVIPHALSMKPIA